jgi:hypothetical protein
MRSPEYVRSLVGTIGADPVHRPARGRLDRTAIAATAAE